MIGSIVTRSGLVLGLFAMATAAAIAWTDYSTAERRAANVDLAQQKLLFALVPPEQHDNQMLRDTITVAAGGLLANEMDVPAYVARKGDDTVGVILPATAPDGYSGKIQLLVGIRPSGELIGVRTLAHRETPGLGDKVDLRKSDWILEFSGRSLENPEPEGWKVRKDGGVFDAFTGATITPRAVVAAVYRSLKFFEQNRHLLIPAPPATMDARARTPNQHVSKG